MLCFRKERTRPGDKTDDMSVLLKAELIMTHKYFTAFEARSALACICWLVAGGGGNITLYLFWDTLQGKCARKCVCVCVKVCVWVHPCWGYNKTEN